MGVDGSLIPIPQRCSRCQHQPPLPGYALCGRCRAAVRAWDQANPERVRERARRYRQRHPGRARDYRQLHQPEILAAARARYAARKARKDRS